MLQFLMKNIPLRCYMEKRCFSTGTPLLKSIKIKDRRLPKGVPKRINPFSYLYDKKGRPRRLETWQFLGRSKIPFDKNTVHEYGLNPKEVHPSKWGGSMELVERIGEDVARFGYQPGYKDKDGNFVVVPEMIPEFIVPDLTDCKLKPYVSYTVKDINQSEFTAKDLFIMTYGQELVKKSKTLSHEELDQYCKDFIESGGRITETEPSEDKHD